MSGAGIISAFPALNLIVILQTQILQIINISERVASVLENFLNLEQQGLSVKLSKQNAL